MDNSSSPKGWDDALAVFEEHLLVKGRAENSVSAYISSLKAFGRFYREELKKPGPYVIRLQETDLHAFIDHLRTSRYMSASTVNCAISAIRAFCRFILERRWHKRDITGELRTYHVSPAPRPKGLSTEEVRRLISSVNLNATHGPRDLAVLQLLIQCGLRVNELTRLSVDDVVMHKSSGRIKVRDEKTRSDRVVPLNASVRQALRGYLETCGEVSGDSPFFMSQKRKRLSTKTVQHMIKGYLCAAGRSDLSARDLRHHFALGLYSTQKSLAIVQRLLGHRNIATTLRYIQPTEEELCQAVEELPENIYHGESEK
jgi:site-specific recombinase XerD